ncbi:SOS response-associated peptidase [Salinivirga cyanobacteriivorans]
MCGRFILAQKIEKLGERFNVTIPDDMVFEPAFNIAPGDWAPVIASNTPDQLQMFRFGLTPFWAKKPMYLFNARSEGDRNKANDPHYSGSKDIINKPSFRKPIRTQRCLVPADAFIEGTTKEGLKKPYVIYLKNKVRPFAFAGIWDEWKDEQAGKTILSFSIITTTANALLQKLPHHRSPVILSQSDELRWLNPGTPLSSITQMLRPYNAELMNAYPIDNKISHPGASGRELIDPAGPPLTPDAHFQVGDHIEKRGFGRRKIR